MEGRQREACDPGIEAPLRVLFVVSKLEAEWTGGIGRVVAGHARALASRGHLVCVVGPGPLPPVDAIPGVRFVSLPPRKPRMARVPALMRTAVRFRPDVIHLHSALPRLSLVAAARCASVRSRTTVVVTAHTGSRADSMGFAECRAFRLAHGVVAVSRWSAERAIGAGARPESTWIVHPAPPAPTDLRLTGTRTIAALARLAPSKGIGGLIRAFDEVARTRPGWRLVIGGDGRQAEALRALARGLASGRRIELRGWLAPEARARLFAEATIGVVPSLADNYPATALEWQAHGVATIVSDVGGLREIAERGRAAVLVRPGDPRSLARAMAALMDDPTLREAMSSEALRVSRSRSWSASTAALLGVYRVLREGRARDPSGSNELGPTWVRPSARHAPPDEGSRATLPPLLRPHRCASPSTHPPPDGGTEASTPGSRRS